MKSKVKGTVLAVAAVAALATGGTAIASSAGGEKEEPLRGATLEQASQAALAHTNGGRIVETEVGDDGSAYGVEIVLEDGRQVEVNLDKDFRLLNQEADDDSDERGK